MGQRTTKVAIQLVVVSNVHPKASKLLMLSCSVTFIIPSLHLLPIFPPFFSIITTSLLFLTHSLTHSLLHYLLFYPCTLFNYSFICFLFNSSPLHYLRHFSTKSTPCPLLFVVAVLLAFYSQPFRCL